MKLKKIRVSIPAGYNIEAEIPEEIDSDLIKLSLIAYLGGLAGILQSDDEETKRIFLIRFLSAIVGESTNALHSTQMSNRMLDKNPQKIVEDLIKSLHRKE